MRDWSYSGHPTGNQRVLVTGAAPRRGDSTSPVWKDPERIREELHRVGATCVIHGCAPGVDTMADEIAKEEGLDTAGFPAQWKRYGRAAGPIRNQQMLDEGHPDIVLAFHPDLARSKGTANMIRKARVAGIRVQVFHE